MTPEEYKRKALEQMATAENPWDRGEEKGLDEVHGLDVFREPKQKYMDSIATTKSPVVQALMDLIIPGDIGMGQIAKAGKLLGGAKAGLGLGAAAVSHIKPKTAMDKLETGITDIWDKADVSKQIKDKMDEIPVWKRKLLGK